MIRDVICTRAGGWIHTVPISINIRARPRSPPSLYKLLMYMPYRRMSSMRERRAARIVSHYHSTTELCVPLYARGREKDRGLFPEITHHCARTTSWGPLGAARDLREMRHIATLHIHANGVCDGDARSSGFFNTFRLSFLTLYTRPRSPLSLSLSLQAPLFALL